MTSQFPTSIVPILAGGGTRLSAHIGVLQALNDLDISFNHIVGVSGGAIVAALYASGKPLDVVKNLALNLDFRQFRGFSPFQFFVYGGLSSGRRFTMWLEEQIGDIVFSEIIYDLHIVATDVNSSQPVIFNKQQTPNARLVDAVRYSMGIPLVFSYCLKEDKVLVDGSILGEGALRRDWSGEGDPVCLFRIRSSGFQRYNTSKRPSLPRFVSMVIRTFMIAMSQEYIHDSWWNSTIIIDSGHLSPVEFSLSKTVKEQLFTLGYQSVIDYLPLKLARLKV